LPYFVEFRGVQDDVTNFTDTETLFL